MAADIKQKISLEGGAEIRRQLEDLGKAGEKAFGDLAKSTQIVAKPLEQVSKVSKETQDRFRQLGDTLRPLGSTVSQVASAFGGLGISVGGLGGAIATLSIGGITTALAGLALSGARTADEMAKAARSVGLSIREFQGIEFAAGQAGVKAENFRTAMARLSQKIQESKDQDRKALEDVARAVAAGEDAAVKASPAWARLNQFIGDVVRPTLSVTETMDKLRPILEALEKQFGSTIGKTGEQLLQALAELVPTSNKLRQTLRDLGADLPPASRLEAVNAAIERQSNAFRDLVRAAGGDTRRVLLALADEFAKLETGSERTTRAMQLFGRGAGPQMAGFLAEGSAGLEKAIRFVEELGLVTEPTASAAEQLMDSFEQLGKRLDVLKISIGAPIFEPLRRIVDAIGEWVSQNGELARTIVNVGSALVGAVAAFASFRLIVAGVALALGGLVGIPALVIAGFITLATVIISNWETVRAALENGIRALEQRFIDLSAAILRSIVDGISNAVNTALGWLDRLIAKLRDAANLFRSLFTDTKGAPPLSDTGGFARGGMVRGPGTATSDSILARLSRGEFVINARAVRYFGADLFASLNALALPRFADGGLADLAPATSGRPFTLVLPSGERVSGMTATDDAVELMTRAAVRAKLRSGGRKPSWYSS